MMTDPQVTQQLSEATQYQSVGAEQGNQETAQTIPSSDVTSTQEVVTTPEPMVPESQYRQLQGAFTQTSQQLQRLTENFNRLVEDYTRQRSQSQTQQAPQQRTEWDLSDQEFAQLLATNPKGALRNLIQSEAARLADEKVKTVREELSATQMIINEQRVNAVLEDINSKYGTLPNYQDVLMRAVDYITGPGKSDAIADPSRALHDRFKFELFLEIEKNPQLATNLAQSANTTQQQAATQKMMAAPMTSSSNVQQTPHQPANQQQVSNQLPLSRMIATFDEPELLGSMRPFQTTFREL